MSSTDDQLVADYVQRLAAAAASLPADRRDELIEEISAHIAEARAVSPDETGDGGVGTSVADTLARLGDPDEIVRAAAEQAGPGQLGGPAGRGPTSIGHAPSGTAPSGSGGYEPGPGPGDYLPGGYGPSGPGFAGGAYPNWPGSYGPPAASASGLSAMEIAAVVLLLVGGFLAGIGWIVGVVLLWISPRWRLRDKLLGTLIWPGGLVGALIVLFGGAFFAVGTVGTVGTVCYSEGSNDQTTSQQCSNAQASIPGWLGITLLLVAVVVGIAGPVLVAIRLVRQARRAQQSYAATARPMA